MITIHINCSCDNIYVGEKFLVLLIGANGNIKCTILGKSFTKSSCFQRLNILSRSRVPKYCNHVAVETHDNGITYITSTYVSSLFYLNGRHMCENCGNYRLSLLMRK